MTVLFTDPPFQKHDTGKAHPETARRLSAVVEHLGKTGLAAKCAAGAYKPLTEEQVARVHSAKQVQAVKQLAEHGGGLLDDDTPVSPDSFRVRGAGGHRAGTGGTLGLTRGCPAIDRPSAPSPSC